MSLRSSGIKSAAAKGTKTWPMASTSRFNSKIIKAPITEVKAVAKFKSKGKL